MFWGSILHMIEHDSSNQIGKNPREFIKDIIDRLAYPKKPELTDEEQTQLLNEELKDKESWQEIAETFGEKGPFGTKEEREEGKKRIHDIEEELEQIRAERNRLIREIPIRIEAIDLLVKNLKDWLANDFSHVIPSLSISLPDDLKARYSELIDIQSEITRREQQWVIQENLKQLINHYGYEKVPSEKLQAIRDRERKIPDPMATGLVERIEHLKINRKGIISRIIQDLHGERNGLIGSEGQLLGRVPELLALEYKLASEKKLISSLLGL